MLIVLMLAVIITIIVAALGYRAEFNLCKTKQSPMCYQMRCPCDSTVQTGYQAPCFGYAKMPGPSSGQWYCSNAVKTLVNDQGEQIT